jgi:RimJ/RimL family protein N-acetyltransferase
MNFILKNNTLFKTGYLYLIVALAMSCLAMDRSKLTTIDLGQNFKLVPYAEHHRASLESVVNDPEVYVSIRHGGLWNSDLLDKRHNFYLEKNAAVKRGEAYKPDTFAVCWVLEDPSGKVIGRGGLQDSDEYEPVMTEVFFAIMGAYQWKPGANNLALGKRAFSQIIDWFHSNIGSNVPLRWLSMGSNERSKHLALALGFKPFMKNDKQVEVDGWGKPYLVFQMEKALK